MTDLSDKMRRLAALGHPKADKLRQYAEAFDASAQAVTSQTDKPMDKDVARRFLGNWARARRLWSDCTGQHLL